VRQKEKLFKVGYLTKTIIGRRRRKRKTMQALKK
jgi:hypothetical protein